MSAAIERAVPTPPLPAGLVLGAAADERVLTPAALAFVADLHRRFDARRRELLAARVIRQARFDAGERPDFLAETAAIRAGDWRVAPIPEVLLDRRVEITGPVDRKMIINALNSGAKVFMADFEDSTSPTWGNLVDGQNNLIDAVSGSIEYTTPEGRHYALKPDPAVLIVRPRGSIRRPIGQQRRRPLFEGRDIFLDK